MMNISESMSRHIFIKEKFLTNCPKMMIITDITDPMGHFGSINSSLSKHDLFGNIKIQIDTLFLITQNIEPSGSGSKNFDLIQVLRMLT